MTDSTITLLLLAAMAVAFFTQAAPFYITALVGAMILGILGIVPLPEVFSGLANPTLVLFAGMFVIGAALFHTGLAQALGAFVVRKSGGSENRLFWGTLIIAAVLSTFASNTGTTATLIPVILSICRTAGIPASRLLMPMAFTTGYGGFSTLVGTPPNVIVTEALRQAGHRPFGFFEFAWVGIPLALAGMLYLTTLGKRLLPDRTCPSDARPSSGGGRASASATPSDETVGLEGDELPPPSVLGRMGNFRKAMSGAILLIVVLAMAWNSERLPLEIVAVAGAMLCVLTGCIGSKAAIQSIEWETILLFGAMFAVASGIENSGAGAMIAGGIRLVLGSAPPGWLVLTAVFLTAMLLGTFLSNTACAALLAPIGLSLSQAIGADPHAVLMTIAVATSCSFLTPLGTPPNALVLGPGGYRFTDYFKVGSGLSLICLVVTLVVVPWRWPLYP